MDSSCRELFPSFEYLGSARRYVDEISEIVDQIHLFEDLNRSEVETLCSFMPCFGAPRGATLIAEGSEGDFLLIILTGSVRVVKRAAGGSEDDIATVAHLGPGASVGEMSMIDGRRRFASCKTAEPTDFAVLSSRNLHEILHSAPRLGNKFLLLLLQMMARRLRDTSNNLMPHITGVTV
jgi:CRP-like cAMP-binding protein